MTEGSDYIRDQTKFKSHRDIIVCAERVTQTHSHHHRRQVRRKKLTSYKGVWCSQHFQLERQRRSTIAERLTVVLVVFVTGLAEGVLKWMLVAVATA